MTRTILFLFLTITFLNSEYIRNDTDDIVIDTKTALIWSDQKEDDSKIKNWKDSLTFCEDLEISLYEDWRIPNYNELYSLIDLDKIDTKISDKFNNVSNVRYWTSTVNSRFKDSNNTQAIWTISFASGHDDGMITADTKINIRCVHDN